MPNDQHAFGIRRRRAIRSALAIVFALPPILMFILNPVPAGSMSLPWPFEWRVAYVVCTGASFIAGWGTVKESWTGEDHDLYVDEPEVNDDW